MQNAEWTKQKNGEKQKPNNSAICIQHSAFNYGGVAQLGEHLPCKQGVMGSNPIISTMRYGIGQKRTLKLESKDSNRGGSEWQSGGLSEPTATKARSPRCDRIPSSPPVTFFEKKANQRNFNLISKERSRKIGYSLKMFIENRIKKNRNETDSCILRKTCYLV